jgi:hypothetical protein
MAIRIVVPALGVMLALAAGQPAVAQGFVYPAQGQTPEQQATDEAECSAWATQQTGIDPSQPAPQVAGGGSTGGEVVGGAARGAALGAIGGLIGGSAGTGAAIGAGVGATAGLFNRVGQERRQGQAQQQANAQHQAQLQAYDRARAACLTGRGYTVN